MHDLALRARIESAWRESRWALGIGPDERAFADLLTRYAEPHRAYHDLTHIDACLRVLEDHRSLATRVGEVLVALLFHDAVYDPRAHDNELASARLARVALERVGTDDAVIGRVEAMILATQGHTAIETRDGASDAALLVDVDLSILGEPEATFDAYDAAIRGEYGFVPDAQYADARRAVLESFLARPRIFHTHALHTEREGVARSNLARAIDCHSARGAARER